MSRVALYRHYDATSKLLYVGVTSDLPKRTATHAKSSDWFGDVATTRVEWCVSREHALALEAVAISFEKPLHNKQRQVPAFATSTPDALAVVKAIEEHCSRFGLKPTTVGQNAMKCSGAYERAKQGRMTPKTAARFMAWLDNDRAARLPTEGSAA